MKKNPDFGGGGDKKGGQYISSDDDIPVGFSRKKRGSSHSSFN